MARSMRFWHSTLRIAVNRLLEMTQKVVLKQLFCHRLSLMFKVVLSCWVPLQLSERNKKERVECCQALIMLYQTYGFVFLASHLLVQDESWFYWDSSKRREVWVDPHGKHSITPKVRQTNRKTMILMGFTCKPKRGFDLGSAQGDHSLPEHDD